MGDFAIFTPEVVEMLVARGFEVVTYTDKAWYFEDTKEFERAVIEILEILENK